MKHMAAMRMLIPIAALMLGGCGRQAQPVEYSATLKTGLYLAQGGRGRLCVRSSETPQRAVFIAYAKQGSTNCSASGTLRAAGANLVLIPKGEGDCRIPIERSGDWLTLRPASAACAYYCGPGAALGGQAFAWVDARNAEHIAEPLNPDEEPC